jgi:hypothetical protein
MRTRKANPTISGTQVNVGWDWSGFSAFLDLCEIQIDRGDSKGFVALTFDTQPFPPRPSSGPTKPSTASATRA